MSTRDRAFDVVYVPRADLPALHTTAKPGLLLIPHVPTPFHWPGAVWSGCGVGVTVVSQLDEPVEAVGAWWSKGGLAGRPQVPGGGPSPLEESNSGHTGWGWIDPPGDDDLVAVGSWLSSDVYGQHGGPYTGTNLVLHLRCMASEVDLLVGGLSNDRPFGEGFGGWNPYWVALHEPGDLGDHPDPSVYSHFYDTYVNSGRDTSADIAGTSANGAVSFLARAPAPRDYQAWHILLMLGPRPIATMWGETPTPRTPAYVAARRAADHDAAVRRYLALPRPTVSTWADLLALEKEWDQELADLQKDGMTYDDATAAMKDAMRDVLGGTG